MPFPTAHALLIGIGSYAHASQLNLPITAADASAVAAVLHNPQYCGYPPEQVTLLSDAAASREGVLVALDGLAARAGEGDTVFVFYVGHGAYGDDGYYLTTHDTRLAGRKVAVGTGLREAELIAKLRAIKAKRLLLIINACHSGEISPVLAPGEEPLTGIPLPSQVAAALLGTGEGRVIISACRENQYAFIGPGPLTLFTQALVDGLQGKGVSSNRGYISVFDLYTHLYFALDEAVRTQLPADIRQQYGEKQEPELTILKGVGPFAVALYRGATTLGDFDASGTPPEGTAVREVNPAYSPAILYQHQQYIGGNANVKVSVKKGKDKDQNTVILAIVAVLIVLVVFAIVVLVMRRGDPPSLPTSTFPPPTSTFLPPTSPITVSNQCKPAQAISADTYPIYPNYDPSGYMGDTGDITVAKEPDLVRFRYVTAGIGPHEWDYKYPNPNLVAEFAGLMLLYEPNNWGDKPGTDLSRTHGSLHWEARLVSDQSTVGTVNAEFVIGGITWRWDEKAQVKVDVKCPDSLNRKSLGIKTLTSEWQSFDADLSALPPEQFRNVIGGFGWTISWPEGADPNNPATIVIEVRNIRYER